ncbi:hypothetical protein V6N13_063651 [Hibiscus sabdariffa]|uniref:Uncharacterized protein n=1 Tax=Hibiscus sabdariffa TaxID=183260 RepID=A0ABR2R0Q4_9ROSI
MDNPTVGEIIPSGGTCGWPLVKLETVGILVSLERSEFPLAVEDQREAKKAKNNDGARDNGDPHAGITDMFANDNGMFADDGDQIPMIRDTSLHQGNPSGGKSSYARVVPKVLCDDEGRSHDDEL